MQFGPLFLNFFFFFSDPHCYPVSGMVTFTCCYLNTHKKLSVGWQFSAAYGIVNYGSAWRTDAVNQCLEFMPVGLLGKQNKCKQLFLLLSLDAHNHTDDYSGTLESVRNFFFFLIHITFSSDHKSLNYCTVPFSIKKKKEKKKVKWKALLHPWRDSSSPWWGGVKRNHLCTLFWWWWG